MLSLGPIAFLSPLLLWAAVALPVIWWLLRATPPAARKVIFPAVRLLLGLQSPEQTPDRTPWWLLMLRMVALGLAILALADPVLNPREREESSNTDLLILMDGGWASAPDWTQRQAHVLTALENAEQDGRRVFLEVIAAPRRNDMFSPRAPRDWIGVVETLTPQPWSPDRGAFVEALARFDGRFDTLWLNDGLGGAEGLDAALLARGKVSSIGSVIPAHALTTPQFENGVITTSVLRSTIGVEQRGLTAYGPDPSGVLRPLGNTQVVFGADASSAEARFELPLELSNRITRISIDGMSSAGSVVLADDALRRRVVGLVAGAGGDEIIRLLDPLHYLRTALAPTSDLFELPLTELLPAAPDVIVLADVGTLSRSESDALTDWVTQGGLLIRFAGPRLAAAGTDQFERDPLLPVRLRAGGRSVGGAMSWGAPKRLRTFPDTGPFAGLMPPAEVEVTSQVMAQPDPDLAERTLVALEDGTPLVTERPLGQGQIVLFHVTAGVRWSTLPLSGLFVEMLDRLTQTTRPANIGGEGLAGVLWRADGLLDGFGRLQDAGDLPGVAGAELETGVPGPAAPPGLYRAGARSFAYNLYPQGAVLSPLSLSPDINSLDISAEAEARLLPYLLTGALLLLLLDILVILALQGRLIRSAGLLGAFICALVLLPQAPAWAQADNGDGRTLSALFATEETIIGHILTGDPRIDDKARAGMDGLALTLTLRTAVEPRVASVDLERDELAFFPILYWPVSEIQTQPSDAAYARLNRFLRNGGMIVFDTADANLAGLGADSANGRALQRLAAPLDLPPLEQVPEDHVLTRTFYLLQAFPGRFNAGGVWLEAAPDTTELLDGQPFRQLNDGVSPVLIGANDWAAAWAVDETGAPLFPVGRGASGARQREIAARFGVNLVMYVLTGNYKSDQVHVPALLERLGQ